MRKIADDYKLTFLLLQYLHAIAVLCLGADWVNAMFCAPPLP